MHFLWINQVSSYYLYIKNPFLFYFIWFSSFLEWGLNIEKRRGKSEVSQDTDHWRLGCGLISIFGEVSLTKTHDEGVCFNSGRSDQIQRPGFDRALTEVARQYHHQIQIRWLRSNYPQTQSLPNDARSTARIETRWNVIAILIRAVISWSNGPRRYLPLPLRRRGHRMNHSRWFPNQRTVSRLLRPGGRARRHGTSPHGTPWLPTLEPEYCAQKNDP
jgi:hypothetical protein